MDPFEAIKTLVHFTNDTNKLILKINSELKEAYTFMDELSNDYLNLSNSITMKLDEDERRLFMHYNNLFKKINDFHLAIFNHCLAVQNEQNEKTKIAIQIYEDAILYFEE